SQSAKAGTNSPTAKAAARIIDRNINAPGKSPQDHYPAKSLRQEQGDRPAAIPARSLRLVLRSAFVLVQLGAQDADPHFGAVARQRFRIGLGFARLGGERLENLRLPGVDEFNGHFLHGPGAGRMVRAGALSAAGVLSRV